MESVADDTIVIVTSDHGDMLGERGLWYKMAPFEDSIRVPLIVHAPTHFSRRRVAEPVSLLDLAPTIAGLAGGQLPDVDGVALLNEEPRKRDIPIEYLAEGVHAPQVTIVRGGWKIICSFGEPELVYDVDADPAERIDLAAEPDAEPLRRAVDTRWDLSALDAAVRVSQQRRRIVAEALGEGRVTTWDHPEGTRRYLDTGDDFWTSLARARRP
jgi:choline-sulfatase